MKNITYSLALILCSFISYGQCESIPSSNDGQGIVDLVLGTTTYNSAGDVTYEDFTDPIVEINQAITANLQITFATGYSYNTNVWIDFNDDLVYDNDTELVHQGESTNVNPTTLDASFLVPSDAELGTHNMRIGTADSGQTTPNPCYSGLYGVTVDMVVNVIEAPSCLPPTDLTINSTSTTGAEISWTAEADISAWEYELVIAGEAATEIGIATSDNPLTITGCYSNTAYDLYLRNNCDGAYSNWSLVSFTTLCDVYTTLPFYEGFNSDSTTENCWTILNENGDLDAWDTDYTTNEFEGDEVAMMYTDFNNGNNDDYLISPGLTLTGNERLKFHQRVQSSFEPNDFEVLLSTSGVEAASFTNVLLASASYDNTTYIEYIIDLSAFSGVSYIAFHVPNAGLDGWRLYIDNFIVETIPTCVAPSDLTATNVTSSSVDFGWTANGSEASSNIEYGESGFTQGSGTTVSTSSNLYAISGLSTNTSYDLYVQADCGDGDTSTWEMISFTTLCDVFTTLPFYEGFNSDSTTENCWTILNENGDLDAWDTDYTTNEFEGDEVAMMYTDFNNGNNDDYLISPGLTLTGNERLKFHQRVQSSFEPNDFEVLLSTSGVEAASFTNVLLASASYDNTTYIEYIIDLSAFSGVSYIAFHVPNAGLDGWRLYIDNFIVETIPTCVAPSDLTATASSFNDATLSWTGIDGASSYEIVVQTAESGAPTAAGTLVSDVSYEATGLIENTTYEFYVRANCDANGYSTWAGPFEFYTGYCNDIPLSNDGQGITNLLLESTNFVSAGDVTYEDFTDPIVDISQAVTANLQITFETGYSYFTNVWIDFNNDLVFDNDSELVFQGESTNANPTTFDASFLVPADIALGNYYMRIGTADSGQATPNPCYSGSYGVTVDMIVNITEPPACVPPSGLTADNITGTTADFSWTGNDGNISWEYVLLPTGSEAPTEADTVTTETSVQFTGLDYETTYDVYVISNCDNSETSTWSGPLTFTTAIQSEFTLECGSENININYCYTDNETTTWLFNSDSGFPLEITFNSGTIETFDNITVYDGVDNTGAVLFNNNASGLNDLAGLVIVSTSTSVYIELDSDGFGSCESSTFYTPWDFTVACKTCVTQSATFEVVGACEPNQQFYVDVELTDLGDAININMTDGSSTQTSQSIGVFNFGPYDANSNVVITVTNADDESCSVNSGELTLICAPSPNDCSIIYAGEDVAFCEGTSTNLTAVYHPLGQDSNSYDVTVQQGCPTPPLEGGTPTSVETDDTWSGVIDIGFEFCFFGDTYSQLLVGSNGVLSFELENSEGYNGWSYNEGDTLPNASNTNLTQANIFGAAHDIDPYECGSINYMVLGSAPSRLFVVNFSEVCHFSCDDINSSSQIILYESSNTIDINIYNKPVCETWNGGLAVVGVQNIDDTLAFTPPDRNTGLWEATDEFWRFTPSLGTDDYVFEWYEGGTFIGNDDTVSVSPTETTIYTAAITYNLCTGGSTIVTDTVVVEVTPNPEPIATNEIIFQCPEGESLLEVTVDADIADTTTFYWTYDGVDLQSGPENTYLVPVGQFGEYLVTAINEEGCFGETLITVNEAPLFEVFATSETVYLCPEGESLLEVTVDAEDDEIFTFNWTLNGTELQSSTENTYLVPEGQFGEYLVTAINEEGCYGEIVITVIESVVPELEDGTSFIKCMNEDVELSVTVLNPDLIGNDLSYTWFIDGDQVQSGSDEYYMHTADQTSVMVTVVVTDLISMCESATTIEVANYMNSNCLDMPQGLSPNGDGMNDCLELDHLEDQEDIVKIEIFNRYGVKVFEMNDYMDQWCGQDASDGNIDSEELLPVGTYFYVIQFGSEREPIISWIYLNY